MSANGEEEHINYGRREKDRRASGGGGGKERQETHLFAPRLQRKKDRKKERQETRERQERERKTGDAPLRAEVAEEALMRSAERIHAPHAVHAVRVRTLLALRRLRAVHVQTTLRVSSKMLGGASQTVSKIRVKCNGI